MNKSMWVGTVLGLGIAATGGVIAGYQYMSDEPGVVVQNCYEEEVTTSPDPRDERRIAGTVIGALVGGAVGKDVGDRDITTAAGAAAGALAGNQVQKKFQENRTETSVATRCDPAG
jgi:uncharacterized protein YcfJ